MSNAETESPEDTTEATEDSGQKLSRFRRLALKGGAIEAGAHVAGQVFRFGNNLLMTRLLFPEAYGIMSLVDAMAIGLVMLSDIGIEQSVIQNEKGDKEDFANTAWTMQVLRGAGLYVLAALFAYPFALAEGIPELATVLPVSALTVLLAGLGSTSEFMLRRQVRVGTLALLNLSTLLLGYAVTIGWAYFVDRSLWALVYGNLAREAAKSLATHLIIDVGYRNRFRWIKEVRDEILKFGKWIFASSAVHFLAGFGDRFLLGALLGERYLGIYSIALMLSEAGSTVINKVVFGVLFPIFSRVREVGRDELRGFYYHARARLDLLSQGGIGVLAVIGPWLIDFLWDERYHQAGWMLQVLCVRAGMRLLFLPADVMLMSLGLTKFGFLNNLARTIFVGAGIPLGYHFFGIAGALWAVALADLPGIFVLWPRLAKEKVFMLRYELLAIVDFAVGLGVGWVLLQGLELIPLG